MANQSQRTAEQIREHYEVEKELSNRLRNASKAERRTLYGEVYDELFKRVPHHSQLTRKVSPEMRARAIRQPMSILQRFLTPDARFLEIGAGDCSLSIEVARHVKQVYAIDVSAEIAKSDVLPDNLELIISDGVSIPVPANSVDVAYSNQLMEHLHPDDATEQLMNLFNALKPSGVYVCITPNPLDGPHDVSKDFDDVATGFHLKEYTIQELTTLFKQVGFRQVQVLICRRDFILPVLLPAGVLILYETLISQFPRGVRRKLAKPLDLAKMVARK